MSLSVICSRNVENKSRNFLGKTDGSLVRGCPLGSQLRLSLAKMSAEKRRVEQSGAAQPGTIQDVGGGVTGRGLSPFCRLLRRRTSSPFCGCGGTASWRRPCPGAAEKEGDGEAADADTRPLSHCDPSAIDALGGVGFLTRNVSRGAEAAPQTASNASSSIFVMERRSACARINSTSRIAMPLNQSSRLLL